MDLILRSERLELRLATLEDYPFLRALHTDPEVMRYIAAGEIRTEEQSRSALAGALNLGEKMPGLGLFIARYRETGEAVGNLVLRPPATAEKVDGLEVGYSFARAWWGKGLATEGTRCLMDHAFRKMGADRIVALIHPEHAASRRVLSKLGFTAAGEGIFEDPLTLRRIPTEILEKKRASTA